MDEVSIGRGKYARRGFDLEQVSIVPSRRTRDVDDVDVGWQIDAFRFDLPVAYAATRAEPPVETGGALGVIPAERDGSIDEERLRADIAAVIESGGTPAASVRPQRAEELRGMLGSLELDMLFILGRVVSAEHKSNSREPLNLKKFVREVEIPVVVGMCSSYKAALHLMRTGAAGVVVGSGPEAEGVNVPLPTAIADVRAARLRHLDETGVYVHLLARGAMSSGGDLAKAIVCGADAAYDDMNGHSHTAIQSIIEQLKRSMASCGYESVKEFQDADLVVTR